MDTVKAVVTITEEEEELPMVEVEVLLVTNTEVGIVEVGPLSRDLKGGVCFVLLGLNNFNSAFARHSRIEMSPMSR